MSVVLTVTNLSKSYRSVQALRNVSFHVPQGAVFGILGPNGSGKTTLLSVLMDVLRSNSGSYSWFGKSGGSPHLRKKIGTLLETPNFYSYLSGTDNLKITQAISGRGNAKNIDEVLMKVNLYNWRWVPFKAYSLGMKQRLAIAAALLGNPAVLVLDEPTNGLDPVGIAEIRNLIVELQQKEHTIIMASHLLDEVEKVCSHVAILKKGELLTTGSVDDIMADEDVVELGAADAEALASLLHRAGYRAETEPKTRLVQIRLPRGTARPADLNRLCFESGILLSHLQIKKKKLETKFFELTNNE